MKLDKKLVWLYMVFCMALITSNCIASKLMILPISIFGSPITVTTGIICYPITFLATDIIGELYGKKAAGLAVTGGFFCQIISMIIIVIARFLPAADSAVQTSYVTMFGQTFAFVTASLLAYVCSQKWDVYIFHKIRDNYIKKHGSTKGGKWIWNNVGTITSQFLDSIIYVAVAFGIGFGWFFAGNMWGTMGGMLLAQFIIKTLLALLDTPIFYLLTKEKKSDA